MSPLALYALSLALSKFPPGKSDHSAIAMPECGSDPKSATCSLERRCEDVEDPVCNPPRFEPCWYGYRLNREGAPCVHTGNPGAWVRTETREEGAERLTVTMQALADAATFYGGNWPGGAVDLSRALLSAGGWSTGLKRQIQTGQLRGPGGEVCLMDIQPKTLRSVVPFELARLPQEELAQKVVGLHYDENRRCFEAGALLLVRARRWAESRCKSPASQLPYAFFSAYGTGNSCHTIGLFGDYARLREGTYLSFRARKHTIFPEWFKAPEPG